MGHVAHRRHHVRPPRRLAPRGDTLRSPSNCLLLCHSPRFHRHLVPGSNECRLGRRRCFPMRANRYAVTRPAELPRLQPCDARTHESSSKSDSVLGLEQASALPFAGKRRDQRSRHERPATSQWACPRCDPQPYADKSEPKAPISKAQTTRMCVPGATRVAHGSHRRQRVAIVVARRERPFCANTCED